MRNRNRKERTGIEANLTSLIDVTFLLIVFFVLVSRLNEVESVQIDLPRPVDPASVLLEAEHQVVVTVLPAAGGAVSAYRVGLTDFPADRAGVQAMTDHLADLYRANPRLDVNIRADRATHYEHVEPVMQAVSSAARAAAATGAPVAGAARVNLVVTKDR